MSCTTTAAVANVDARYVLGVRSGRRRASSEKCAASGKNSAIIRTHPSTLSAPVLIATLRFCTETTSTQHSTVKIRVRQPAASTTPHTTVMTSSVVAYATDLKERLLGVDATLLEAHGPVHPRVARQMADGVRRTVGGAEPADVGIATTGIAGPVSSDGQPVGTVHIAVSTHLGSRVESLLLEGDRDEIRTAAAARAITLAVDAL